MVAPRGPQLPKILYKIVQFGEDCKIVTSPKQLLYVTRYVTCDHVIRRSFRTLIPVHENVRRNFRNYTKVYREMVFKDCKAQEIVSFLLRFQGGCRL